MLILYRFDGHIVAANMSAFIRRSKTNRHAIPISFLGK